MFILIVLKLYEIGPCEVVYVAAQDCEEFYEKTLKYIENSKKEKPETLFIILHFGNLITINNNANLK